MTKYVVMVLCESDTFEGRGRMAHALVSARDLLQAGAQVKIVFAGIGVTWMTEFAENEHPFTEQYGETWEQVKPNIIGVCNFCDGFFKTTADTEKLGFELLGEGDNHVNLSELLADGSQLLTF